MIDLKKINNTSLLEFKKLYELYEQAFPEVERRNYDILLELVEKENLMNFSAIMFNQEIVGLLVFWNFEDFIFVEHFAIFENMRNTNLGSKTIEYFLDKHKGKNIVGEIEHPTNEINIRRKKFYQKYGFEVVDENYIQPTYSKYGNGIPLLLLAKEKMTKKEIENCKKIIRKEVYKCEE
ncbi:MAG: GNAT family N-acetyltransferase [Ignavibacteria bacterium]|nr:GNAT family N-acetyltransferase [Ignavibacteria bacterium]